MFRTIFKHRHLTRGIVHSGLESSVIRALLTLPVTPVIRIKVAPYGLG